MASRRSTARSTGSRGRPRSISASATPTSCTSGRAAIRSWPSSPQCAADQISIETAQSGLDLEILRSLGGKTIILGVIDLGDPAVETPEIVADRIRRALRFAAAERIIPAPDCGMKYIPRATAFAKLKALAAGAALVRRELTG